CVRPPDPCRPSKLRFEVLAQRSPGASMSGFIPRHMLHPDSRHSKPASLNTLSMPSFSAADLTCCDPDTTIARTFGDTFLPFTIIDASIKSSSREFVHEPMKTLSTLMSVIGVP